MDCMECFRYLGGRRSVGIQTPPRKDPMMRSIEVQQTPDLRFSCNADVSSPALLTPIVQQKSHLCVT